MSDRFTQRGIDGTLCLPSGKRQMILADLYAYRVFGWHQFGWPLLPLEWYETILWHGVADFA